VTLRLARPATPAGAGIVSLTEVTEQWGTKVCRYSWHSAGSLQGWPFPVLKYKYVFQIKYTEAILSNSTRRLLRFEITSVLIAVFEKLIYFMLFLVIFGTLSFPISSPGPTIKGRMRIVGEPRRLPCGAVLGVVHMPLTAAAAAAAAAALLVAGGMRID